jgi:hypothetical protein
MNDLNVPLAEAEALMRELEERFLGLPDGAVLLADAQGYAHSRGYHLINPHYGWSDEPNSVGRTVRLRALCFDGIERVS